MAGTQVLAGTSGFSYAEWKGSFYPADLASKKMLTFYASRLPAVEINNTFYRMPKASVLENWLTQVPEGFVFAIKASRRITHMKRLKDCGEETAYLLKTVQTLGSRLGALLFQLPPHLRCDVDLLRAFLKLLPADIPAAFEFRHASWGDAGATAVLKEENRPVVWVDSDDARATELPITADWAYLRLRRAGYNARDLQAWRQRLDEGSFKRALVFFKHEDEGAGPRLAAEFLASG